MGWGGLTRLAQQISGSPAKRSLRAEWVCNHYGYKLFEDWGGGAGALPAGLAVPANGLLPSRNGAKTSIRVGKSRGTSAGVATRPISLGQAGFEAGGEGGAVEVFADEDEGVGSRGVAPFLVKLGIEKHVDALEDEALGAAFDREDSLAAVDVVALSFEEVADPVVELLGVEVARSGDTDGRHFFVVGMGVLVVLLPDGFHVGAIDGNMERMIAAAFENEVGAGGGDLEFEAAITVVENEALQRGTRVDGFALGHAIFPIGKRDDGHVPGGFDHVLIGRNDGHDNNIEFVLGVMVVVVLVIAVGVVMTVVFVHVTDDEFVGADRERISSGPLERVGKLEEFGVEVGDTREGEATDVEHAVERDVAVDGAFDAGGGVHAADTIFEGGELGGGDEIGFVENDDVGEGDLLFDLRGVVEVLDDVFGVDDRDNTVDAVGGFDFVVGEEGLGDGAGVGEAGGFDQDAIEPVLAFHEAAEHANEIAAHAAADATVVHLEEFFVALDDELIVDADFAEFVFDNGEFLPVLLR